MSDFIINQELFILDRMIRHGTTTKVSDITRMLHTSCRHKVVYNNIVITVLTFIVTTSLTMSTRLLQGVNNLFLNWNKNGKNNL